MARPLTHLGTCTQPSNLVCLTVGYCGPRALWQHDSRVLSGGCWYVLSATRCPPQNANRAAGAFVVFDISRIGTLDGAAVWKDDLNEKVANDTRSLLPLW
eukprot:TRINITY_DN3331_c0_g1_i2.p2 TRINITY_DN3331_c0_g1~~TRINITY_DN3331_c0_g1_i2.p2  ORF type:complete len:100 (+),score=4.97 TRINITY_DN3331_c0_g1_i2:528-827(+)